MGTLGRWAIASSELRPSLSSSSGRLAAVVAVMAAKEVQLLAVGAWAAGPQLLARLVLVLVLVLGPSVVSEVPAWESRPQTPAGQSQRDCSASTAHRSYARFPCRPISHFKTH